MMLSLMRIRKTWLSKCSCYMPVASSVVNNRHSSWMSAM